MTYMLLLNCALKLVEEIILIVGDIVKKKLEWIGHVVRMDQGRTVKKIFESKTEGSIRRGRSRLSWKMWRRTYRR